MKELQYLKAASSSSGEMEFYHFYHPFIFDKLLIKIRLQKLRGYANVMGNNKLENKNEKNLQLKALFKYFNNQLQQIYSL